MITWLLLAFYLGLPLVAVVLFYRQTSRQPWTKEDLRTLWEHGCKFSTAWLSVNEREEASVSASTRFLRLASAMRADIGALVEADGRKPQLLIAVPIWFLFHVLLLLKSAFRLGSVRDIGFMARLTMRIARSL